jgi:biotin carboxylase
MNHNKNTLWIVSGGIEAIPGICKAKEMGLKVVVSDGNSNAPGFMYADKKYVASTYDVQETLKCIRHYEKNGGTVDGIISIGADVPLTVSSIAEELSLPSIKVETAKICSNKLLMKEEFKRKNIPTAWFSEIDSVKELRNFLKDREKSIVLKPVDSRGARGVLKLDKNSDLMWAFKHSKKFSTSGKLIAEEFETGSQHSTESIFTTSQSFTPGFTDRNYEYLSKFSPYMIENGGEQPTALTKKNKSDVINLVEKASRLFGIKSGTCKGDMILTSNGPKIIEIAPRLSGGWLSTDQIPLGTGVDFLKNSILLSLGKKIKSDDIEPKFQKGVAIRYFFPKKGIIKSINGLDFIKKKKWIHKSMIFVKKNDVIPPITDHTKRVGFVITTGKNRIQSVDRAIQITDLIKFRT